MMTPHRVQLIVMLSPSTQGVVLFVGLNQIGASVAEVARSQAGLAIMRLPST
jgi:hypothetical protein